MGFLCQVEDVSSVSNMLVVFIMIVCRILLDGFSHLFVAVAKSLKMTVLFFSLMPCVYVSCLVVSDFLQLH